MSRATGRPRGRPRKFDRPARAVTLTLPEDVIEALVKIDEDLSHAIVRAAHALIANAEFPMVELSTLEGRTVIVVPRSQFLRDRIGVELVPLKDGRALIAFDAELSVSELELRLADILEDATVVGNDRAVIDRLAAILREARRGSGLEVRKKNIVIFSDC